MKRRMVDVLWVVAIVVGAVVALAVAAAVKVLAIALEALIWAWAFKR